jgi:pyrroloquinoline quinone biosynthesis protein D
MMMEANPSPPRVLPHDAPLRISPQYRLQWEPAQNGYVLLFPEGMVQLQGGAGEILKRVDGRTSVEEVILALEAAFPGAALRSDVIEFMEIAYAKGWIREQPGR